MNLDTITVKIRPRNSWEAMDIGFILARQWYSRLWRLWLLTALPATTLFIFIGWLLPGMTAKWSLFFFWLCKPLYEPPILYWISQALFGSQNTLKKTLTETRQKLSFKFLYFILLQRLNPFRAFSLPVLLLERLQGKESRKRQKVLKEGHDASGLLTGLSFFIEIILTFSLMIVIYWLIPDELRWIDFDTFIFTPDRWILLFAYIISCSIFAPFYICASFMIYISRRVELEAWDIEIGFKKLHNRLQKLKKGFVRDIAALLVLFISTSLFIPEKSWCAPNNPETARETIKTVLQQKEFGEEIKEYRWVQKKIKEESEPDSAWEEWLEALLDSLSEFFEGVDKFHLSLAKIGKFLLWSFAIALILYLLIKYTSLREWLTARLSVPGKNNAPPEIMFGMDLRPESLPDDLKSTCLQLLSEGNKREAMSLLYRGTLSRLVNGFQLEVHSSYTENECCDEVKKSRPKQEATFFSKLTSLWVLLAYGHRNPDTDTCRKLIGQWEELYGERL